MVPISGITDGAADAELDALGSADPLGAALSDGLAVGLGVASATLGAGGMMPAKTSPTTIASTIDPAATPIDRSDAWSVGKMPPDRPPVAARTIGAPHERQTCAHAGLGLPQLKHSTVSPLIGREPSMRMAAGGENADGPLDDPATGQPGPILADPVAPVEPRNVSGLT